MQLCSASHVPGVPGENGKWLSGSKASVISAEPGSLIPGLILVHAARPQLCLCSPLILSICVWDHGGTPVLYLAFSPSLFLSPHPPSIIKVEPKIKMSPVVYMGSVFSGETCKSAWYYCVYTWCCTDELTPQEKSNKNQSEESRAWKSLFLVSLKFQSIISKPLSSSTALWLRL